MIQQQLAFEALLKGARGVYLPRVVSDPGLLPDREIFTMRCCEGSAQGSCLERTCFLREVDLLEEKGSLRYGALSSRCEGHSKKIRALFNDVQRLKGKFSQLTNHHLAPDMWWTLLRASGWFASYGLRKREQSICAALDVFLVAWMDSMPAMPDYEPIVLDEIVNETGFAQFTQTAADFATSVPGSIDTWRTHATNLLGALEWASLAWQAVAVFLLLWFVVPLALLATLEALTALVGAVRSVCQLAFSLLKGLANGACTSLSLPFILKERLLALVRGARLSKVLVEPISVPREACKSPDQDVAVVLNSIILETACAGSQAIICDVPRHVITLSARDPALRTGDGVNSPLQIAGMATLVSVDRNRPPVLITALHVVEALEEAEESTRVFVQVREEGPVSAPISAFDFEVIGRATSSDVAVISVNSSFAAAFQLTPVDISHPRTNSLVTLWGVDKDEDGNVLNVLSRGSIYAVPSDPPGILRHKATSTHGWSGTGLFQAFGGKMRLIGVHRGSIPGRDINVFHPIAHLFRKAKINPETPWSAVLVYEEPNEEMEWQREEERLMERDRRLEEAERREDWRRARAEARAEREQTYEEDDHFERRHKKGRGKMDASLYYDESGIKVTEQRLNSLGAPSSTDSAEILETSMMEPVIKSALKEEQKDPAPPQESAPLEKSTPRESVSCTMDVEEFSVRKTLPPGGHDSTTKSSQSLDALTLLSQRLQEQEERMEKQRLHLQQQELEKEARRAAKRSAHLQREEELKAQKAQKEAERLAAALQKEEQLKAQKAQKEAERQAAALIKAEVDRALAEERRQVKERNIAKAKEAKNLSDQRKAKKSAAKPKPDPRPLEAKQYDSLVKLLQNLVPPTDPQQQSAPH